MIQRIQTVYLFMAVLITAITFFTPLARFTTGVPEAYYTLYGLSLKEFGLPPYSGTSTHSWVITFLSAAYILTTAIAIFSYKNRQKQLRRINIAFGLLCCYYAYFAFACYAISTQTGTGYAFAPCCLLPLLSGVFAWLAAKAIRRDEALVRAADRIR